MFMCGSLVKHSQWRCSHKYPGISVI